MDIVSSLGLTNFVMQFSRISMYPFFDMAHYTLAIMSLKEQSGAVDVAHRSPIACWFSGMLCCFGGSILASLLLGEPPIESFTNNRNIILASVIWYLIFYCPYDKFYKCCNFLPSKLFIAGMKEVTRARKIVGGVMDAHSRYRNGWLAMIAVGWAKGAGSGLLSNFEQLVRGVWMPEKNQLLKMPYATKVSLIGAVLFTLQEMNYLPMTRHNLIFLYTMFVVSTKVAMVLFQIHHSPFAPMEAALYNMAFSWQSYSADPHFNTPEPCDKGEPLDDQCTASSGATSDETDVRKRKTKKAD
ncbi:trimeric intracellular cation channel type B [Callorhinchus milii]|uniref:Transmembrane protein 38B n=1 Tax=Callorhinchus milii TaxID=7868 RepID=V9KPA0_CALMI|nr:trimeric intracellular cation channel type B [Callorhinchus milii]|eukprot:gi/632950475/ref/XP_007890746.1/ PREDICTED: trimeric intracellular cation channel type B-like [Callorhinchus milii]